MIDFELTHPLAKLPVLGSPGAAGFDIFTIEDVIIPPLSIGFFKTGLRIKQIAPGVHLQLMSRSSIGLNRRCVTILGLVDNDFKEEITPVLFNTSPTQEALFSAGERVSQIVFYHTIHPPLLTNARPPLQPIRTGGFGSTDDSPNDAER